MSQQETKTWLPWIAAVIGGGLAFLGYAGFGHAYLEWICLVPVLWAIRGQSPVRAFFIGWVAGIVGHGGGFYWVIHMFQQFAAMAWPLAALGLVLLAAANGLVFAAWAGAVRLIAGRTGWRIVWVSPVVWTALEKFWPEVFPNYLGASQFKFSLLTQIADITGILGVSFVVVYVNSLIFSLIEERLHKRPFSARPILVFTAVFALVFGYGAVRIHMVDREASGAGQLKIGIVQANLDAGQKYTGPDRLLREHQEMSRKIKSTGPVDLILWPEGICSPEPITSRNGKLPPGVTGDVNTPTLFGAILSTSQGGAPRLYNSAVLADGSGAILGTYEKMVLVPFGEYIPFGDTFPWLYSWSPYSSHFWPGKNEEPLRLGKHLISVNICYEDIFPGQIRRLMRGGRDRRAPEAMFNMTDDSWYGDTVEPTEHLALASFRAIEHRRVLVRTTNTGISAVVDPVGRIPHSIAQWTKGTIVASIPMMQGRTVYAVAGDWIGWLCGMLVLFGIGRGWQLHRRSAGNQGVLRGTGKKRLAAQERRRSTRLTQ